MRKSFTDMNQVFSKTALNPDLKKSLDQKAMAMTSTRIMLDPIKPLESIPKTTESPKGGAYRK